MVAGGACTNLSMHNINIELTPPTVIVGDEMYLILSSIASKSLKVNTDIGQIEVNFGIE